MQQWGDKYRGMVETRDMLDENVKVLNRRIGDMEVEVGEKSEISKKMQRANMEVSAKLDRM